MRDFNDRADDIIEHLEKAQSEINKAISKINGRKIWLKLSALYKLAAMLGKIEYVKEEMKRQESRRLRQERQLGKDTKENSE